MGLQEFGTIGEIPTDERPHLRSTARGSIDFGQPKRHGSGMIATGELPAVGRERQTVDLRSGRGQLRKQISGMLMPESDLPINRPRRKGTAVRRDRQSIDLRIVCLYGQVWHPFLIEQRQSPTMRTDRGMATIKPERQWHRKRVIRRTRFPGERWQFKTFNRLSRASHQCFGIRGERECIGSVIVNRCRVDHLACSPIPEDNLGIATDARENAAVGRKGDAVRAGGSLLAGGMSFPLQAFTTGQSIPNEYVSVEVAAGNRLPIRRVGDGHHKISMAHERMPNFPC